MLLWDDLGPLPLALNDEAMSPNAVSITPSPGFNDMSCFFLMCQAAACHKKMLSMPESTEEEWNARLQLVQTFESTVRRNYVNVSENAPPLEKFAAQAALGMINGMHLVLRRPPYKQQARFIPPSDTFDVLGHSLKVLERELHLKAPEFAPFAWKSWVQWHALAIVLAELCNQSPGPEFDAAYSIAVKSFENYARLIGDSEAGMLWKPIAKLMARLQHLRALMSQTSSATSTSVGSNGVSEDSLSSAMLDDAGEATAFKTPSSWIPSSGETSGVDAMSSDTLGNNEIAAWNDSQFNWSTFMDDVSFDQALDLNYWPAWNAVDYNN